MAGGGKGGSQTSRVQLPQFIEDAAQQAVAQGQRAGQIGFVPYTGPDVAAFTPAQEAAFAGTNQAAAAFGLPTAQGTGLPEAQTFAGGVRGFSSAPLLEESMAALEASRPGQFGAIQDFFIDPVTGAAPEGLLSQPVSQPVVSGGRRDRDRTPRVMPSGQGAGFTGFRDMFDGGGPGASGDRFEGGGLISDLGNRIVDRNEGGLLGRLL